MFAYYLDRMQNTPDGDGSLLDNSMILYGSGMSDGNGHNHHNLPTLIVGGGTGTIKGNRHIQYAREEETPITNLFLDMLEKFDLPMESFGDSSGNLDVLAG